MKGFALLALALALESAFLFSIQLTPSRDEAAARLWGGRPSAAPSTAHAAPQQDEEPRLVDVKEPIVVVVRG